MEEGWYLSSSPIITANWLAPSNKWAADRRRHRQDFPDRRPADKCFATGVRLRAVANRWTEMGRARLPGFPVSTVAVQPDETCHAKPLRCSACQSENQFDPDLRCCQLSFREPLQRSRKVPIPRNAAD